MNMGNASSSLKGWMRDGFSKQRLSECLYPISLSVIRHKHVLGVRKNVQKKPYMDFPLGLRTCPREKSLSSDFLGLSNNSQ